MNVFTRSLTDDLASLVKKVDKQVGDNEELAGFVVLLSDDADAAEDELKAFAKKHKIKNVPLTVFDGVAGPPNYKVAKDAEVTVHLWKSLTVESNFAYAKGKLNKKAVASIVKGTKSLVE